VIKVKLVSYRVQTSSIEDVISAIEFEFCDLDIMIDELSSHTYIITFNTYNNTVINPAERNLDSIHEFFTWAPFHYYEKLE